MAHDQDGCPVIKVYTWLAWWEMPPSPQAWVEIPGGHDVKCPLNVLIKTSIRHSPKMSQSDFVQCQAASHACENSLVKCTGPLMSPTHDRGQVFLSISASLSTQGTCQTAHFQSVPCVLCMLCFTLWLGMQLYSHFHIPVASAQSGDYCKAGDFHANSAFSFLDSTQRPITIYTIARVSLLLSCSLEHGPSIIAEKQAVETQFLPQL